MRIAREELEHSAHRPAGQQRHTHRRSQAGLRGRRRPREVGVGRDLGQEGGPLVRPGASRQSDPPLEGALARCLLKARKVVRRNRPGVKASKRRAVIERPVGAELPTHPLAQRTEQPRNRLLDRLGLGQHRRETMLRRQEPRRPATLRDVVQEGMEDVRVAGPHRRDRQLDQQLVAIAVKGFDLEALIEHRTLAGVQKMLEPAQVAPSVALRDDRLGEDPPDRLLARPAEGGLSLAIPIDHEPARVHRHVRLVGAVENRSPSVAGRGFRVRYQAALACRAGLSS